MDLLERFKFLDAHFNGEETKHDITELRNEVMKYDVYDVIARISALNLIPENQNKAVLFDSLIDFLLSFDVNFRLFSLYVLTMCRDQLPSPYIPHFFRF